MTSSWESHLKITRFPDDTFSLTVFTPATRHRRDGCYGEYFEHFHSPRFSTVEDFLAHLKQTKEAMDYDAADPEFEPRDVLTELADIAPELAAEVEALFPAP